MMNFCRNSTSCKQCNHNCLCDLENDIEEEELKNNISEISLKLGDTVLKQDSFVSQVAFLKEGIVKKVLEGRNEKNVILNILEPGQFIALPELIKAARYPFSLVALSDCKVCFINRDWLTKVGLLNRRWCEFMMSMTATNYAFIYQQLATNSTRNNYGKLASTILYLTGPGFKNDVMNLLSRKELAELAISSKESVNKILQQLHHDGIIKLDKHRITLLRRDLLEKLSTLG